MAVFYSANPNDKTVSVNGPFTITRLQALLCGFIKFVDLSTGEMLVVNEAQLPQVPINHTATTLAGKIIRGGALLCDPEEIA